MSDDREMTKEAATALFDSLEPAVEAQMIGRWRGEEIVTGHPMNGMLGACYWHGKRFEGPDAVHPLVHHVPIWGECSFNPGLLPLRLLMALPLRDRLLSLTTPVLAPLLSTRKPKARLRMIAFRGRLHAAMCYDARPINDVFARVDADRVMGWMDFKGMEEPFFFRLIREG